MDRASASVTKTPPIGGYNDDKAHDRNGDCGFQVQSQEEVSLELAEERERAVRQLEANVVDANEIFKDLATMIKEQGDVLDSIEDNVHNGASNVEHAKDHLEETLNHQNAARKKKCCILVVSVVVAAALGLIIYFLVRK